ncbi:hypothetical protein QRD89_17465 [Halobacillus sp. ACCC02827]|uniref:hypothetical protein n=1 Tax=Halobacillus sp. ACCC02827 TaxID=3052090 RepID=UPI002570D892|nr:hypothetical protein [Halobacillus sp. ACCC02827]WJE15487.1 hypothetical protein QRD89_17465 [Halobacillus sp. ACCC02827]
MNNKKKIQEALDNRISEKPLFTDRDRRRFYEGRKRKHLRSTIVPRLLTALLAVLFLSGTIYYVQSSNLFEQTASPEQSKPESETEPLVSVKEPKLTQEAFLEEFKQVILTNPLPENMQDVLDKYGSGETLPKVGVEENATYTYAYHWKEDNDGIAESWSPKRTPDLEDYQNGEIDVFLEIDIPSFEVSPLVKISTLSEDGKHVTIETFYSNPTDHAFKTFEDDQEPLEINDLLLRSIARDLNKKPEEITKADLMNLQELTINASHLDSTYVVDENEEVFEAMQSLRVLKLNHAVIPGYLLKHLPILEQVTIIGDTVTDLSSMQEGMQHVQYLNIASSSFNGTVDDLLKLKSLTIVRLDPTVVPNYEELQFEGIDVRW